MVDAAHSVTPVREQAVWESNDGGVSVQMQ